MLLAAASKPLNKTNRSLLRQAITAIGVPAAAGDRSNYQQCGPVIFYVKMAGKLQIKAMVRNMSYVVQTGDTIAAVTQRLNCSFSELKRDNPTSLGRTSGGRWFLKDGVTVDVPGVKKAADQDAPALPKVANGIYEVAPGETVRGVCRKLGQPFALLRSLNPEAVGQTEEGRWFFKSGAKITTRATFEQTLAATTESQKQTPGATGPTVTAPPVAMEYPPPQGRSKAVPPEEAMAARAATPLATSRAAPEQPRPVAGTAVTSTTPASSTLRADVPASDSDRALVNRVEEIVKAIGPDLEIAKSFAADDISRPYQGSMEEVVRYKAAMAPSLDLTLGLVQENRRQEDILAGVSDGPMERAMTMGLRFKF